VAWRGGVQLAGSVVWCDAERARDLDFVSHARRRLGVRGAHGKVLATARTLAFLRAAGSAPRSEVLTAPFGRPFSLGGLRLELFPSGHVPGAASLLFVEPSGRRIAYAGDVNPVRALGEPCEVRGADVVVLEAPLAPLGIALPPREQARAELRSRVVDALADGRCPIVLAPALGAAQEAIAVLGEAGVCIRSHPRIYAYSSAYREQTIDLPPAARFAGRVGRGEALLWPIEAAGSAALRRIPRPARIALTARPIEQGARGEPVAHVPLVDHADLTALVEYVTHTGAREAWVTVGDCAALVEALAARGVAAHPLGPPRQMELFG